MQRREKIPLILLFLLVLLCLPGCRGSRSHCYLCKGIAYEGPCLVDLATGNVAELKPLDNEGYLTWTKYSSITVEYRPDGAVVATIPKSDQQIARKLFCDNCLAAIDAIPHSRHVIADLHDLSSIQLFPIDIDESFYLRSYHVTLLGTVSIPLSPRKRNSCKYNRLMQCKIADADSKKKNQSTGDFS